MSEIIPIIILNWNGLSDTCDCIDSVLCQTYPFFSIYLVDNGSKGNDAVKLAEKYGNHPKIHLIRLTSNLGFTKGINQILKEFIFPKKNYRFVILLNNDTITDPKWLERLYLRAGHSNAGMVSSKMINFFEPSRMDNAGHKILNTGEILPIGQDQPENQYHESFENMGACAGAALYSLDMLRHIGLFDEFFQNGYEDAELGLRAVLCGYQAVFEPSAVVFHKISRSINKIRDFQYTLKIQMDVFYTCLKLLPLPILLLNLPFFLFKLVALFIIDLLFIRWKFLKVLSCSLYLIIFRDGKKALKARREFYRSHRRLISSRKILQKMEFFLWFDIKRFVKYILFREKMVFEKY